MPDLPPDAAAVDLDTLAARAADGDERAASTLFADLSERLASVAKRRVREDEVDDCVQDALAIVAARYRTRGATVGILPWSFSVMRNVIGNLYQKRHRVDRQDTLPDDDASTALAAPAIDPLDEHSERWLRATVVRGLRNLERTHARCGAIFRAILEGLARGDDPDEVVRGALDVIRTEDPAISRGSFHVVLHRCRARLRRAMEGAMP